MFGKTVVIVVLLTLVKYASLRTVEEKSTLLSELDPQNKPPTLQNESTQLNKAGNPIVNNGNAPKPPQRQIIRYLNCSDLTEYSLADNTIEISNFIILAADNPCYIKASVIILDNNHFPDDQNYYRITGKKIVIVNNDFKGPEQFYVIAGDNVVLDNNTFRGNYQDHLIVGYNVTVIHNVFEGECRLHKYAATDILMLDNESKGNPFYDMVLKNPPNIMHDMYPEFLSNHKTEAFNDIKPQMKYSSSITGTGYSNVSLHYGVRFPLEMKFAPSIRLPIHPNKALINFITTCRLLNENHN